MDEALALPTDEEVARFAEEANNGFAQKSPYAAHVFVVCVFLIILIEQVHTRSRTQSNTLLLFLAIVIAQVLARGVPVQAFCSCFPDWLCDYGGVGAGLMRLVPGLVFPVWFCTMCSCTYALKNTKVDWRRNVMQRAWNTGLSLDMFTTTPPTESMLPQMSLLMLLVFLTCAFYEHAFRFLYLTATFLRFVWLCLHWAVVPLMIKCKETKPLGELVENCMRSCSSELADVLSAVAASDAPATTIPPPGPPGPAGPPGPPGHPGALDGGELMKNTAKELKAMLVAKGLSPNGPNKAVLVNRLLAAPP